MSLLVGGKEFFNYFMQHFFGIVSLRNTLIWTLDFSPANFDDLSLNVSLLI